MSECVEWEGARSGGYGIVMRRALSPQPIGAHRLAFCRHWGIPLSLIKGLCVLHTCDNPACVNPEHLGLGTHADNMRDKRLKGRGRNHLSKS